MSIYGQPPEGIIVRGHYHEPFVFQHSSGTAYVFDNVQPNYLDFSLVVCSYCHREYSMYYLVENRECEGCGSKSFHNKIRKD